VRALVKPELAEQVREETYRFCESPACDVVYFSEKDPGHRFGRSDLRVRVGQKETEPPIQVCYCFDWTAEDIEREFRLTGTTTIPDRVKQKIQQGFCRCETMNPQGICCLGEVNKAAKEVRARLGSPAGWAGRPPRSNGQDSVVGTETQTRAQPGHTGEKRAWLATLGAFFTAVLGSACCWLPLLLIAFGFSAAGVGSFFEQYRLLLLTVTFVLLGAAWYLTYRMAIGRAWARLTGKPVPSPAAEACCVSEAPAVATHSCCPAEPVAAPEACCAPQTPAVAGPPVRRWFTVRRFNEVMLWVATVVILLFVFFPHWVGYILGSNGTEPPAAVSPDGQRRIVLKLEGLTCEGCAATTQQALRQVPGVAHVEVSYARSEAVVMAQAGEDLEPDALVRAVEEAGYKAQVKKE
jgi:copper chaperone CopZ